MYDELFKRNQEALSFIQKETDINSMTLNSTCPISCTSLKSITIIEIADIMTKFAEMKVQDIFNKVELLDSEVINLKEDKKKIEFMIENGLGWDDMQNDITMPHEL